MIDSALLDLIQRQLQQQQQPFDVSSVGATSLYKNPFAYQEGAMQVPEPDDFFGLPGFLMAKAFGLTTTNDQGEEVPLFRTNLRMHPSGKSNFEHMQMRNNQKVSKSATKAQEARVLGDWGKLFGEGSTIHKMVNALSPNDDAKAGGNSLLQMASSPMVGKFAMPVLNQLLGYDRGVSANIANAYANPLAAAYLSQNGRAGQVDPFGEEFTNLKKAFASNISGGVQSVMYDGAVKKASMHGASEELVTKIMMGAFRSGEADKLLKEQGLSVESVTQERQDINAKMEEIQKKKNQVKEDYKKAEKYGDTEEMTRLAQLDEAYDEQLKTLGTQLDNISKKIGMAMEPLVSSVTGVVDSLKDFYGSEQDATAALDRLTGGMGSKDKATADMVNDKLMDLKVLGGMLGMDPRVTGQFLTNNLNALSAASPSKLAQGSATEGMTAMEFTKDFMGQLLNAGGDPKKVGQLMEAQTQSMNAFGQSKGYKAAILLETAKKSGAFDGDDELYQKIKELMASGSVSNLEDGLDMLARQAFGSRDALNRVMKDPSQMAMFASMLNPQEAKNVATLGSDMRNNELKRFKAKAAYESEGQRRFSALRESGIDSSEIREEIQSADFDAIMETLSNPFEGEDPNSEDATRRQAAYENFKKEYEVALEETGGNVNEAKKLAVKRLKEKDYLSALSPEQQEQLLHARGTAQVEALKDLDYFRPKTVEQRGENMFNALDKLSDSQGIVKDKDGNEISKEEIDKRRKQYQRLVKEGKTAEASQLLDDFESILGGEAKDQVRREGNMIQDSGESTFFSDVGATNKEDGQLTRTAMTEATKDLFTNAKKLGKTLVDKDGKTIDPKVVEEKEKQYKELIKQGKEEEARDLAAEFYGNLGSSSQQYIKDKASRKVYRTDDVIQKENKEDNLIARVAKDAKLGSFMNGLDSDNGLAYAHFINDGDVNGPNSEKMAKFKENLMSQLAATSKDPQGDMEKIIKALQDGDEKALAEVFASTGLSKEQLFSGMNQIFGEAGAEVVSKKDTLSKKIKNAKKSTKAENEYLNTTSLTTEDRLFNMDAEQTKEHFKLLGAKPTDKQIERYQKNLEKAKQGDRGAYLEALRSEQHQLDEKEAKLQEQYEKAKTPEERKKILEQIEAVQKQKSAVAGTIEITSGMSDTDFKKAQQKSAENKKQQRKALAKSEMSRKDRLTKLADDKALSREYLEALAGRDLSDEEVEAYQKNLEKAKSGDMKAYKEVLKAEDVALSKREADLEKEIKNAKTPEERKEKEKELRELQEKRLDVNKQIASHGTKDKDRKGYKTELDKKDKRLAKEQKELKEQLKAAKTPEEQKRLTKRLEELQKERDSIKKEKKNTDITGSEGGSFSSDVQDVKAAKIREEATKLEEGTVTLEGMLSGEEGVGDYLELLGGEKASKREISKYQENIEKIKQGGRKGKKAYIKNLETAQDKLDEQREKLQKQLKNTEDPEERKAITEKLKAIETQSSKISKEKERVSGMSKKEFTKEVREKEKEKKDKEDESKYEGLDKNIAELCKRVDKLCGILEDNQQSRGVR